MKIIWLYLLLLHRHPHRKGKAEGLRKLVPGAGAGNWQNAQVNSKFILTLN